MYNHEFSKRIQDAVCSYDGVSKSLIKSLYEELRTNEAKEYLSNIEGDTVRITLETNSLVNGTITFADLPESNEIFDDENNILVGVSFNDGVNNMERNNQKLESIKLIEAYRHGEWICVWSNK